MNGAKLIEPGVKYFLNSSLKICNKKKNYYNNNLFNLGLFAFFLTTIFMFLYYKYKTRPTKKDIYEKEQEKKYYILSKIKKMNDNSIKEEQKMITNLPRFESDYELMHKNF